jgi:hypothetical protein
LEPKNFHLNSNTKVWWKCPKGNDHEWEASISSRTAGHGCPYCSGRKECRDNRLDLIHPEIAEQWHPTKNGDSKPSDFPSGATKKVWWKCSKGEDHEWEATINNRTRFKNGCPCCIGRKACKDNRLDLLHPKVAKQWHPTKNGDLKPSDFPSGSAKKVWWKCRKGDDHEWKSRIAERTGHKRTGCACCAGHKVCKDNRLDLVYPEIAKEWHPTKNGELKPSDFTSGSAKKLWWKCPKGDDHEWEASIINRTTESGRKSGCPCCVGKKVCKDNRLDLNYPEIAKQWHQTKNGNLKPSEFTAGSGKKVWWKCSKGDDHEWEAMIVNRTKGGGCPCCYRRKTSKDNRLDIQYPEIARSNGIP